MFLCINQYDNFVQNVMVVYNSNMYSSIHFTYYKVFGPDSSAGRALDSSFYL